MHRYHLTLTLTSQDYNPSSVVYVLKPVRAIWLYLLSEFCALLCCSFSQFQNPIFTKNKLIFLSVHHYSICKKYQNFLSIPSSPHAKIDQILFPRVRNFTTCVAILVIYVRSISYSPFSFGRNEHLLNTINGMAVKDFLSLCLPFSRKLDFSIIPINK